MDNKCCIHYDTVDETKLVSLTSIESWKTLLRAATILNHTAIVELSGKLKEDEIPQLSYHKTCRPMFTLKRDLQKLDQSQPGCSATKVRRASRDGSCSNSTTLPKKCIFCDKADKYLSGKHTRDALVSCQTFIADKRIRKCAAVKNDKRIMALTADELVAKEACYHKRCYSVYTISLYNEQREWHPEGESFSDMAINCLREMLAELYESPDVVEFKTLIDVVEKHLVSRDVDKSEIFQTKKNLRRKIETNIQGFQFLNVHEKLLINPESLIIEEVIKKYIL